MSDTPEKKHSWAKFQAKPGTPAPPKSDAVRRPAPVKPGPPPITARPVTRSPAAKPVPRQPSPGKPAAPLKTGAPAHPAGGARPAEATTVVSDELAAALNQLAKEYAAPAMTNAPFVTAMQRAEDVREQKRRFRIRLAKFGAVALVAAVALHFTITLVLYRTPSVEALTDHVNALPGAVIGFYSSALQPLQPGKVTYSETDRISVNRIRYAAEVTLQLRKPLYVPASTNGTNTYRVLQESLELARQRDLKHNLFAPGEGPDPPVLPLLLQVSHRAGDSIVVRMSFEARRTGWRWRLGPPQVALRSVNRAFRGEAIEYYQGSPYLIFGAQGTLAEVRLLIRQARAYIVAVTEAVQKTADLQAAVEKPADAGPATGADPANKPALSLEELSRLFDPDAPAIDAPAAPPATDPNAPAVPQGPG